MNLDANMQLQISTSLNDGSMSPVASPSPNSRNQFIAPPNKGRLMMNPQQVQQMQGVRPVAPQLQRQRMSPFSPQSATPQSPNDLFPGSPSAENFSRSDDQQFLHSPQTPKPMGQQQQSPGTPNPATMSPVYANQPIQPQNIRTLENMGPYVQAPGTPRPSFNPGQTRTTVYARPDMFAKPPFIQAPNQPNQDQNNRQLRDLLQRTQAPTNLPGPPPQVSSSFNLESEVMKNSQNQQQLQQQLQQQQQQQGHISDNTFRQPLPPLPPGMRQPQQRMQAMVGGQMVGNRQIVNPQQQRMIMTPNNAINPPRQILQNLRPGLVINQQQQQLIEQQMSPQPNMNMNQPRMTLNTAFNPNQGEIMVSQNQQAMMINNQQVMAQQRAMNPNIQHSQIQQHQDPNVPTTVNQTATDTEGIPDSVTAELEKLEQDENVGMDGVGDILGGLGDDDDDLLNSLTAEMGADFNILEYADPELDTTDEKTTLLDSLEMDENDNAKDDKLKNIDLEKAKAHFANQSVPLANLHQVPQQQNIPQNRMGINPAMIGQQQQQQPAQAHPQQHVDIQNQMNPNPGTSQQGQLQTNQQMLLAQQQQQQQQQNNFQRQQVRFKTHTQNQILLPEIQQIHQQMMLQVINIFY